MWKQHVNFSFRSFCFIVSQAAVVTEEPITCDNAEGGDQANKDVPCPLEEMTTDESVEEWSLYIL